MALKDGVVIAETTFADLGFKPRADKFALANAKLTLVRPQPKVYLGFPDIAFANHHFLQYLVHLMPNHPNRPTIISEKEAVIQDLLLPDLAFKDRVSYFFGNETENMRTDRLHREDPMVGPSYIDFDLSGSRRRWLLAIASPPGQAPEQVGIRELHDALSCIKLAEAKPPFDLMKAQERVFGRLKDRFIDPNRAKQFSAMMVDAFTEEEREKFALGMFIGERFILLDFKEGHIYNGSKSSLPAAFVFNSDQTVAISTRNYDANQLNSVKVRQVGEGLDADWEAVSFTYPEVYDENALKPLIAWRNTKAGRVFLKPFEVNEILGEVNLGIDHIEKHDPYLGTTIPGYLLEEINNQLKQRFEGVLKRGERPNRIMEGAMAIWFNIKPHSKLILANEAGLFPAMERAVDKAA